MFRPAWPRQPDIAFRIDGLRVPACRGETVIAALLAEGLMTGRSEFDGQMRCGFCLMGVCQDCTIWTVGGQRLRACMTEVKDGMELCREPFQAGFTP